METLPMLSKDLLEMLLKTLSVIFGHDGLDDLLTATELSASKLDDSRHRALLDRHWP